MTTGISIIVCCYNSTKRLPVTLQALQKLQIPQGWDIELVLIDNNSTDGTAEWAMQYWVESGNKYPMHCYSETRQGIGYARLCGVEAARFGFILFVDDDNELHPDYLMNGCDMITQHSDVGVLAGISHGVFQVPLPEWIFPGFPFKPLMNALAVSTSETSISGYLDDDRHNFVTAGTFFRKDIFETVSGLGHELILKGRTGKTLLSGEDEEFCYWAKMMGYRLYRSDNLHFNHHIESSRIDQAYFERLFFGFGYGSVILDSYWRILRNEQSLPDESALRNMAANKIRVLKFAHALLSVIAVHKSFKITLLIKFQEGILAFLKDRPELPHLRADIKKLCIGLSGLKKER
jgi:glycosyltransferase involved in cell wall biosynthesis